MKPIVAQPQQSMDEEAAETLLQAEEENLDVASGVKQLTYGEIGFGPAKSMFKQFNF